MSKVTILGLDAIAENSGHQMTGMAVSVCTTPAAPSPLPIPYPTVGSVAEGIIDAPMRTKINGAKILTVGGCMKACHGNEPGTLKEIISLNTGGPCFPWLGAPTVFIELGMAGMTGAMGQMNKSITVGAGTSASGAGGASSGGGGASGGGAAAPAVAGPQGPSGSGGGGGSSHQGASGPPGSSSAPPDEHTCQDGHPVNVATGDVVDQAVDIALPGLILLVWKRYYSSARHRDTGASLGAGWAHSFEQHLREGSRSLVLRDAEGRSIYFAKVARGESTFHRRERLMLSRDEVGVYRVYSLDTRLSRVFTADIAEPSSAPARLTAIHDVHGNSITIDHHRGLLRRAIDTAGREVRVTWERERITRLEVFGAGKLLQRVEYRYSASGCLAAVLDALGHADTYEYDARRRMVATMTKLGERFTYTYDASTGRCSATGGTDGLYAIDLEADLAARTTRVRGEEPRLYTWNAEGLMTREALPDGRVLEERAYDDDGFLVAEVDGDGHGTQHWYDARGNRVRSVDAEGATTETSYDENDLPVARTAPDGLVTRFSRDGAGTLTRIIEPSGRSYSLTYDDRGRLTALVGDDGDEGRLRTFAYDEQHNLIAETDARGATTTFTYDAAGRPLTRTDALGRQTRVHYDALGRPYNLSFPDGTRITMIRDPLGNVVRETDSLGRTTTLEYAGMGVLTRLVDAGGRAWRFEYTSKERLKRITNPRGEVHAFARDHAGRVLEETTFDGRAIQYRWLASGRLGAILYPDGTHRTFTYDRAGALVSDGASDGSVTAFGRDPAGRIVAAVIEEGSERVETVFDRDPLGRLVAERQGDQVTRYRYDAHGRRAARVLPNGDETCYRYDAEGALASLSHGVRAAPEKYTPGGGSTPDEGERDGGERGRLTLAITRDVLGREITRASAHAVFAITSAYDAMDRLIEQRAAAPRPGEEVPAALLSRRYAYDEGGRVTSIDDVRWGTTHYAYDRAGALVEATRGAHREVFSYDGAGALIEALEGMDAQPSGAHDGWTGGVTSAWKVAPGNLLEESHEAAYTYDGRGRRIAKCARTKARGEARTGDADTVSYVWDLRDRLREVRFPSGHRVVMTYDAFGRRVRKEVFRVESTCVRSVTFVWDGDALAAELDRVKGARSFAHAPGTLLPLLQQERGEVFAYVNDHLGTPKELLDRRGLVAWSAAHAAWGQVVEVQGDPVSALNTRGRVSSPFRLLGQYADEETGLCATRFRYFDPAVGRWLSPDPLGIAGGLTAFGFDGCPTSDVDPLGLSTGFFRGGSSVEPKPGEYKVKDGLVQPTHGVSVFSNPDKTAKWGTHEIESIPPELQIKQRGKDPEHYEIMPKEPMSEEQYKAKLGEVKLKKKGGSPHH